jgi:hypothetical protein
VIFLLNISSIKKMMIRVRCWAGLLTIFCLAAASSAVPRSTFDKDQREDCAQLKQKCTEDENVWLACPHTCTLFLEQQGNMAQAMDPESFHQLEFTTHEGKTFDLDDYQGYVTLFAVVPLLPGMSQYYYELVHHVQTIFPYTLETIVMPLHGEKKNDIHIKPHTQTKVVLLKETTLKTRQLDYFSKQIRPLAGSESLDIRMDRVTFFIVSTDGKHIERLISPTMKVLERRIQVFLQELDSDFGREL